jgi:type VI protein secretion system component VasF
MDKEKKNVPQEFQNNVNDHKNSKAKVSANLEDNDIQSTAAPYCGVMARWCSSRNPAPAQRSPLSSPSCRLRER